MNNQRSRYIISLLIEISILAFFLILASFCMYFYFRQFTLSTFTTNKSIEFDTYVTNYVSFPIEYRSVLITDSIDGIIKIGDENTKSFSLKSTDYKSGEFVSSGSVIGVDYSDNILIADFCGYVIDCNSSENITTITCLDYSKVNLYFEFDLNLSDKIKYDKDYECVIAGKRMGLYVDTLKMDTQVDFFMGIMHMSITEESAQLYLYNNEPCSLIIESTLKEMYTVNKNIVQGYDVEEGDNLRVLLKDGNGNYQESMITVNVIGDKYYGISSNTNLDGMFVCVEKQND